MKEAFIDVIEGAGEWYGLDVEFDQDTIHVDSGRIGRAEKPLRIEDGYVDGGWYVEPVTITLHPAEVSVEIMRDLRNEEIVWMIRTNDNAEVYNSSEYELLLRLLWKDDDEWHVAIPRWIDEGSAEGRDDCPLSGT